MDVIYMKLSMEKEYLVQNVDVTELDFFKQDLKKISNKKYLLVDKFIKI